MAQRNRRTFPSHTALLREVEGTHYIPATLVLRGKAPFDRRAATLDKAATAWLKSRKARPTSSNGKRADGRSRTVGSAAIHGKRPNTTV